MYIELAVGQGETLASANQTGTPYRMVYDKTARQAEILAFSSYSFGLFADLDSNDLVQRNIDYSQIVYTQHPDKLKELGC